MTPAPAGLKGSSRVRRQVPSSARLNSGVWHGQRCSEPGRSQNPRGKGRSQTRPRGRQGSEPQQLRTNRQLTLWMHACF